MPDNFTPLSHKELRELWKDANTFVGEPSSQQYWKRKFCDLVLSAIWWESQKIGKLVFGSIYPLKTAQERFLAKLAEIGIKMKKGEDG